MRETQLYIAGTPVRQFERIGYIDGAVHWAIELDNNQFLTLTSTEFGEWIDASNLPPLTEEPKIRYGVMVGVFFAAFTAVLTVGLGWFVKVGLL